MNSRNKSFYKILGLWSLLFSILSSVYAGTINTKEIPHLITKGTTTQLIVDGKPFIMLGGELGNSTFTSLENMESVWPKLKAMHLNTVLVPVYWELIEPVEDEFHFELYDKLIKEARKHDFKLVILWFGSWKNSMSSHAPAWVKKDQERFPRVKDNIGRSHEILTPFSENNLKADLKAYQALMQHIKKIDQKEQTIIMMQPENEIGMLPVARDYHPLANEKFNADVPDALIDYLKENKETLVPEFKEVWERNGYKDIGTWEDIFGEGPHTDEIFMAWYYAQFANTLCEAGKKKYPLPVFVNAALNRPGRLPGVGYPSAGPLPHIMDVWMAGGLSIDFLAPDIYFPNIEHWCDLYVRRSNPLFIPETRAGETGAANALFTIGHYESLGFSPFSIESTDSPETEHLGQAYQIIDQLMDIITEHHGQERVDGVLFDIENQERILQFGDYEFTVNHSYTLGYEANSRNEEWEHTGALIVQTGDDEFYLAGSGIVITFRNLKNPDFIVGILKAEEGKFIDNQWKVIRHLNGDQTHQGRHIRILRDEGYFIQRFELYNYK